MSIPLVATLSDASRLFGHDARLQSDLAAAYLVRSRSESRLDDAARALTAARIKALDATPSSLPARFNVALALESMLVPGEARAAWQHDLDRDQLSEWAIEARRHLDLLPATAHPRDWDTERRYIADALQLDTNALRACSCVGYLTRHSSTLKITLLPGMG